ncbi:hypothetical protein PLEOSDRAFT_165513 [Pleurotus ostreatus PC15]|uniref:Uncharacterized protein n=1 Tax=Pleurotus ostreatus (strain PC15) TaxID=1137138 RepID=A0A067NZ21_PLEO1|nr:hypothetical protein PLEOSDRAFT_165513 [Pleurotus ostreatus PC15]
MLKVEYMCCTHGTACPTANGNHIPQAEFGGTEWKGGGCRAPPSRVWGNRVERTRVVGAKQAQWAGRALGYVVHRWGTAYLRCFDVAPKSCPQVEFGGTEWKEVGGGHKTGTVGRSYATYNLGVDEGSRPRKPSLRDRSGTEVDGRVWGNGGQQRRRWARNQGRDSVGTCGARVVERVHPVFPTSLRNRAPPSRVWGNGGNGGRGGRKTRARAGDTVGIRCVWAAHDVWPVFSTSQRERAPPSRDWGTEGNGGGVGTKRGRRMGTRSGYVVCGLHTTYLRFYDVEPKSPPPKSSFGERKGTEGVVGANRTQGAGKLTGRVVDGWGMAYLVCSPEGCSGVPFHGCRTSMMAPHHSTRCLGGWVLAGGLPQRSTFGRSFASYHLHDSWWDWGQHWAVVGSRMLSRTLRRLISMVLAISSRSRLPQILNGSGEPQIAIECLRTLSPLCGWGAWHPVFLYSPGCPHLTVTVHPIPIPPLVMLTPAPSLLVLVITHTHYYSILMNIYASCCCSESCMLSEALDDLGGLATPQVISIVLISLFSL